MIEDKINKAIKKTQYKDVEVKLIRQSAHFFKGITEKPFLVLESDLIIKEGKIDNQKLKYYIGNSY